MGPSKKEKQTYSDIRDKEMNLADTSLKQADTDRAQRDSLFKPAIDWYKLLSSGDATANNIAASPAIAAVDSSYKQAAATLRRTVAPGPGLDMALADLERKRASSVGTTISQNIAGAPDKLATIGSGLGSFSLNELGAAFRGTEGAATIQKGVMDTEAQAKASTLGLFGSLASAGGMAASGGLFGLAGAAGGSAVPKAAALFSPGAPSSGTFPGVI